MTYGVAANAAATPERTALVCGTRRLTYGELDRWVNRVAGVLAARGLGPGGRVALLLPNVPEFLAVTHAAAKLGALAVPINWRWRRGEIAYVLEDAAPDVFVLDEAFVEEGAAARAAAGRPAPEHCLVVGASSDLPSFEDAVENSPDAPSPGTTPGGFNILVYTSGTTGRPKGVMHPTFDPKLGFESQKRLVELWGFGPTDVHLVAGPMYHTMPNAYAAQHLFVGATVVIMPRFDAGDCLRLIASERVTTSSMVPAHFIRILELPPDVRSPSRPLEREEDPARGGAVSARREATDHGRLSPRLRVGVLRRHRGPGTIISPEEWLERPGSVGRPLPGITVKILRRRRHAARSRRGGHHLPVVARHGKVRVPQRTREDGGGVPRRFLHGGRRRLARRRRLSLHRRPPHRHGDLRRRQHLPGRDRVGPARAPRRRRCRRVRHSRRALGRVAGGGHRAAPRHRADGGRGAGVVSRAGRRLQGPAQRPVRRRAAPTTRTARC